MRNGGKRHFGSRHVVRVFQVIYQFLAMDNTFYIFFYCFYIMVCPVRSPMTTIYLILKTVPLKFPLLVCFNRLVSPNI